MSFLLRPCVALLSLATMAGCSTGAIILDREEQLEQLATLRVAAMRETPPPAELAQLLGPSEVHAIGDVVLHAYRPDFDRLRALHAAAAAPPPAPRGPDEELSAMDIAVLVLVAPIAITAAALALPVAAADLAVGYTIAEPFDDRAERAAGRVAIYAYDPAGAYRWHACCLLPEQFGPDGPDLFALPDPTDTFVSRDKLPPAYRRDRVAMGCHRAKQGDAWSQLQLFRAFDRFGGPAAAYYWARILERNPADPDPDPIRLIEAELSPEALREAEATYRATPLVSIDCAALTGRLLAAMEAAG